MAHNSSAALPIRATTRPHFSGMFVALTATTANWTQRKWRADCDSMVAAGFNFIAIPHTGRQIGAPTEQCPYGTFSTMYPVDPAAFNDTGASCFSEVVGAGSGPGGVLGTVARAAAAAGLMGGVHLGLMFAPAEHGFPSQHRNGTFLQCLRNFAIFELVGF